jgi:hypothetical protein
MTRWKTVARWLLVSIAAIGVIAVAKISYSQFTGQSQCPQLGMFPACYVVLAFYALILISAVFRAAIPSWVFWIGWAGVFVMAITGTALEIAGSETCPRTGGGTPTCYFSLAIAIVLALLFVASTRRRCPTV